jgi:hypothetical protein
MPIKVTNTLTGEVWNLPDPGGSEPINLSAPPYSPGLYDIRNSSPNAIPILANGFRSVTVPDGDSTLDHLPNTWSIGTNENLYSHIQVDGDYAGWMTPSADRGKTWIGGAVPLLSTWFVISP